VGRATELAAIRTALEGARLECSVVLLEGEPGIGKSRLVAAATELALADGFTVCAGAGEELSWDRPFGPLVVAFDIKPDAEDEERRTLDGLLRAETEPARAGFGTPPAEHRYRVIDGMAELVERMASRGPVLIVVENLHWTDPSTLLTLPAVRRHAAGLPVLVVATTRPSASAEEDHRLDAVCGGEAVRLRVEPLSTSEVTALVRSLVDATPGDRLIGLVARAGGNPLFVIDLVEGLVEAGSLEVANGIAEVVTDALPESFSRRVLRILGGLDPGVRGVLRAGAILGSTFTSRQLVAASGRSTVALMQPIEEAIRAGFLHDKQGSLAFRHDLVRAVVYDQIPEPLRRSVHRAVAQALADAGEPELTVAAHFARGGEPGDHAAVNWLHRSARRVCTTSPETALALIDRALELAGANTSLRDPILPDRLESLVLSGRLDEAEAMLPQLAHLALSSTATGWLRRREGAVLLFRNRATEAAALLEDVGRSMGGAIGSDALAEAALAHLAAGDMVRAHAAADHVGRTGSAVDAPAGTSLGLCVLSRLASHDLALAESLALADAAVSVADADATGDAHRHQPLFFRGLTLHDLDRLSEVDEIVADARSLALDRGAVFAAPLYHGLSAFSALRAGRLEDAVAEADAGGLACTDMGMPIAAGWCYGLVAIASLHLDDVDGAGLAIATAEEAITRGPPLLGWDVVLLARALFDEELGEQRAAFVRLRGAWELFDQLGVRTLSLLIGPDLARLAIELGEVDVAVRVGTALADAADRVPLASWRGAALAARGLADDDPTTLLAAVDSYRASPRTLALARACEDAGAALCRSGRPAEGRAILDEAITLFDGCGARRDRARAAATLRAHGGRPRPSPLDRGDAWGPLSSSEQKVARLLSEGLTNPEIALRLFVSRRTVESHLHRIFAKLGIRSRVDLAVWVSRHTVR
jgi:DNA-binding CsgD family transcriptional regulator